MAQSARAARAARAACAASAACGLLALASPAQAQDGLTLSLGAKLWNSQWTSFSYGTDAQGNRFLTQNEATDRMLLVPVLSLRWRDVVASVSGYRSGRYQLSGGSTNTRSEFDANLGYVVWPGVVASLGYKRLAQEGDYRYRPTGLVAGVSATAPLGGAFSLYGSLALGRLSTPRNNGPEDRNVEFDAGYRLTEVGLAYSLAGSGWPRQWTFTGGYRAQVLVSRDALPGQDANDITHGFSLGVIASF